MAKKLYRSTRQKMLGGVCGGLAEYFDLDVSSDQVNFCRPGLADSNFTHGSFYLIAWLIIPLEPKS